MYTKPNTNPINYGKCPAVQSTSLPRITFTATSYCKFLIKCFGKLTTPRDDQSATWPTASWFVTNCLVTYEWHIIFKCAYMYYLLSHFYSSNSKISYDKWKSILTQLQPYTQIYTNPINYGKCPVVQSTSLPRITFTATSYCKFLIKCFGKLTTPRDDQSATWPTASWFVTNCLVTYEWHIIFKCAYMYYLLSYFYSSNSKISYAKWKSILTQLQPYTQIYSNPNKQM